MLHVLLTITIMASKKDEKRDEGANIANLQQQTAATTTACINRAIEETRDNIKRTTEETRREIPKYGEAMTEFQRQSILIIITRTSKQPLPSLLPGIMPGRQISAILGSAPSTCPPASTTSCFPASRRTRYTHIRASNI
jgi:hypothetical protein